MSRVVRHLKDDIYQLLEIKDEPYDQTILTQGSLTDIESYIALEERGLL